MAETNFLTYKDKPLVRSGNEIYYGDMSDAYVVRFEILSSKTVDGNEVADKINVQLLKSDIQLNNHITQLLLLLLFLPNSLHMGTKPRYLRILVGASLPVQFP